jgi:hypothetical protein
MQIRLAWLLVLLALCAAITACGDSGGKTKGKKAARASKPAAKGKTTSPRKPGEATSPKPQTFPFEQPGVAEAPAQSPPPARVESPQPATSREVAHLVGNWEAQADPPKSAWTLPEGKTPQILLRDHPVLQGDVYGHLDSPYFLMFSDFLGTQVLRVFDLRDDRQLCEIKLSGMFAWGFTPSPDGRHAVVVQREPHQAVVYSVADEKVACAVPRKNTPARLAFISAAELLVLEGRETEARIVSVETGDDVRKFSVGHKLADRTPYAISPDGRYLLLAHRELRRPWKIRVFELAAGKQVGEIDLPARYAADLAIDVSPDGQEFAVMNLSIPPSVVCWNLSDGKQLAAIDAAKFTDKKEENRWRRVVWGYGGRPLLFAPDRSSWLLYGHAFLARAGGELAWKVPYAEFGERTGPYRFMGADRLLLLLPDRNSVPTGGETSFAVMPWPPS